MDRSRPAGGSASPIPPPAAPLPAGSAATASEIEGELATSRDRVREALDKLQGRLTPAGILDEMLGTARRSEAADLYETALRVVRRNPLPVLMIAAGATLLWRRVAKPAPHPVTVRRDRDALRPAPQTVRPALAPAFPARDAQDRRP